jgi:cysteinyl-tRNA synthetase
VRRLDGFIQRLLRFTPGPGFPDTDQNIYDIKEGFAAAMDDDLNISVATAVLFEFVRRMNIPLSQGLLTAKERDRVLEVLRKVDGVLGVMKFEEELLTEEAFRMIQERETLRKAAQWAEADRIRRLLLEMGVEVSDTPDGVVWRLR